MRLLLDWTMIGHKHLFPKSNTTDRNFNLLNCVRVITWSMLYFCGRMPNALYLYFHISVLTLHLSLFLQLTSYYFSNIMIQDQKQCLIVDMHTCLWRAKSVSTSHTPAVHIALYTELHCHPKLPLSKNIPIDMRNFITMHYPRCWYYCLYMYLGLFSCKVPQMFTCAFKMASIASWAIGLCLHVCVDCVMSCPFALLPLGFFIYKVVKISYGLSPTLNCTESSVVWGILLVVRDL